MAQIRNKTKAHGAVGTNFFSVANEPYIEAIRGFLEQCPVLKWHWFHIMPTDKDNIRLVSLRGESPCQVSDADVDLKGISKPGVYLRPDQSRHLLLCADMLRADLECFTFFFPNGGYSATGEAWFIKGILFIFDNFETVADTRELHEFLDTYTHLPNKVLITSRERAFKADFPIEVRGMEYEEASKMLLNLSLDLSIESLITNDVINSIYEYSEGHPYVMRILIG